MNDVRTESISVVDDRKKVDLYSLVEDVAKQWIFLLFMTLAAWLFAYVGLSWHQQATYSSSATVAVNNVHYASNVDIYDMTGYSLDVAAKLKNVFSSEELLDTAARELGFPRFQGNVSVEAVGESNLIRIRVQSGSPSTSFLEVKSILKNYKAFANDLSGGTKYTILEQPKVQEKAEPFENCSKKATLAAVAVFLMLCMCILIQSLRRDCVTNGADVIKRTGTKFLGSIYRDKKHKGGEGPLITAPFASLRYSEGIRKLAVLISRTMDKANQKVLLITSTARGEGKNAAAANIAIALSQTGKKVVLLDLDFYDPALRTIFNIPESTVSDLVAFLEKYESSAEQIEAHAAELLYQVPDTKLSVISSNKSCPDATERFGEALQMLVRKFRNEADYVIITSVPAGVAPDVEELAALADVSVLAIRRNQEEVHSIRESINTLGGEEHMLGCILTDMSKYSAGVSASNPQELIPGSDTAEQNVRSSDKEFVFDLFQLLRDCMRQVVRHAVVIFATMLALGALGYAYSKRDYKPSYTAYATFTVNPKESVLYKIANQKNICIMLVGRTFPSLLNSEAMVELVKEDLGYEPSEKLDAEISSSVVTNTNLLKMTVRSSDPQLAYDVLQSVLKKSSVISNASIGTVELEVLDESGVPERIDNAKRGKKYALLGMIAGLMIWLVLILLKQIFGSTVLSEGELSWITKAPCYGRLPWINGKGHGSNNRETLLADSESISLQYLQSLRAIRGRLENETQENETKIILITSAKDAEGKTTTAANLALSLANHKHNVLLVDGDLRKPAILEVLGKKDREFGLVELIAGKCTSEQAMIPFGERENLTVLPCVKAQEDPLTLWNTQAVKQILHGLREQYDYVIIDGPQSSVYSDCAFLTELADGCLFVVRRNYAAIEEICEGFEVFNDSNCMILGCAICD